MPLFEMVHPKSTNSTLAIQFNSRLEKLAFLEYWGGWA